MKKRKSFKCTVLILAVLLFFSIGASALETTLTTTVPSEFLIKLEINGNGNVKVEDKTYFENTDIVVKRNEWISYKISPNENFKIKSVFFNGEDVTTKLEDNVFKAFSDKNITLKIVFTTVNDSPVTSDNSNLLGAIFIMILSFEILLILTIKKEQSI